MIEVGRFIMKRLLGGRIKKWQGVAAYPRIKFCGWIISDSPLSISYSFNYSHKR